MIYEIKSNYRAFHSDIRLRERILSRIKQLLDAQIIEQGQAPTEDGSRALISNVLRYRSSENYTKFSKAVDFPEWVTICYESLFESLPEKSANKWAIDFLQFMPVGVDLNMLKFRLFEGILNDPEIGIRDIAPGNLEFVKIVQNMRENFIGHLISGNQKWLAELGDQVDRLDNPSVVGFNCHCALLTLGWMLIDRPINALAVCRREYLVH